MPNMYSLLLLVCSAMLCTSESTVVNVYECNGLTTIDSTTQSNIETSIGVIVETLQTLQQDVQTLKQDLQSTSQGMQSTSEDVQTMKQVMQSTSQFMQTISQDVQTIKRHVQNHTHDIENIDEDVQTHFMKDCYDIQRSGRNTSSVYEIKPDNGTAFDVYCDMETDLGGWTVFQRRMDGSVDFYLNWTDYKIGFGNLDGEFWLGNDKIHRLTNQGRQYELRVDLEAFNGDTAYAEYTTFSISDETDKYRLTVDGYSGTAGDSLTSHHNGMMFSTKDDDNDIYSGNCAESYTGAWWYRGCHHSNLNGQYLAEQESHRAVRWYHWKDSQSLKHVEMKIRPAL